jgi:hypothetical protein
MNYRNLLKKLQETNGIRLDDEVTVYDATLDEYMPAKCIKEAQGDNDVLDEGHLYIVIGS